MTAGDAVSGRRQGAVTQFDKAVGLGVVTAPDGTTFPFHCIEIADGTRDIAIGRTVSFGVLLKLGRAEAADITPA